MTPKTDPDAIKPLWVALLLLALPVIIFWRPMFFYIEDAWTALIQMAGLPFGRFLVMPDGEQWFPFFHLVFYGLVKSAGERYSFLVLVNCLGTGVNAFLLYLFFRRHFRGGLALTLSLFYAGAAVHHAIAWNSFYVCYLLSLGFFLGALLLTDSYLKAPTGAGLWGIGLLAGLSVLSHNYTLTGLVALPLYALIMGAGKVREKFWPLALTIGVVYLVFAAGYFSFAGAHAATSHNLRVFFLPGPAYLVHLIFGAFLAPCFYLFWGHFHFPVITYVAGGSLLALSLAVVWQWGASEEKRLVLWALLANLLPFVLISLTRYQRSVNQAFVPRYAIFTLMGALILVGTAWRILNHRMPRNLGFHLLALGLLAVMVYGQIFSLPRWYDQYLQMSRAAQNCYQQLNRPSAWAKNIPPEEFRKFCPTAHPSLTPAQAAAIHRLLNGPPEQS